MILWSLLGAGAVAGPRGVESGVTPPPGLDRAYASRRVALVVGIDRFHDPEVEDLRFAAKDAHDVARVLEDPEVGAYDVVSVVSGEVGREAFWGALDALGSTVQRDDTVLVYVATHGTLALGPGGSELFLIGSDGSLQDATRTGIRVEALASALDALPARRTVMILDACYAGTGRSVVAPEVKRRLEHARGAVPAPSALIASTLSAHLYAAHVHQPALEDPSLGNGVYTHFLLEALRGAADQDQDGLVEVMEAHGWARDRTLAYTGGAQVPWVETMLVGRQELYLAGDPSRRATLEQALLEGLESLPQGTSVVVDGAPRGAGPLEPGVHHIEVRAGDATLLSATHRARVGERLDLGAWTLSRAGRTELSLSGIASTGAEWLGSTGALLDVRRAPADPSGPRWVWGASLRAGAYDTGRGLAAAGTAGAVGWWAHDLGAISVGPQLGVGVAWRLPAEPGPQGAPMASPGLELRTDPGHVLAVLQASVPVFAGGGQLVATPTLSLGVGWRLDDR